MSWAHVRRAIESELKGLDKLVLIMIANHVNDDPKHPKCGLAWPSVTTLAKETGVTRRSIHRILNRLESGGFLTRENHGTRSTHYRLSETQRLTNARARKGDAPSETQGHTTAFMGQGDTPSETQSPTGSDTESYKPPRETPKESEEERGPLQGGPLSSLSALGSGEPDPTRAPRISALAPGNGVKEEKRCQLRATRRQQAIDLGMSPKQIDGMDDNQLSLAIIDARLKIPSDAPTSDTESVALYQGP